MKNEWMTELMKMMEKNLPTILTSVGVITEILTVSYSVYAGYKIKEIVSSDIPKEEKIKKTAIISIPVVAGTVISCGCSVASHKEHNKQYTALAAAYAASKIEPEKITEKAVALVEDTRKDTKKVEEVKDNRPIVNTEDDVLFKDVVTGYSFRSNLRDFWDSVRLFNEEAVIYDGNVNISYFYELLLGQNSEWYPAMDSINFGSVHETILNLNPLLDTELDGRMKPYYTFKYKFIDKNEKIVDPWR